MSAEQTGPSQPQLAWWQWHRRLYNWVIHWADTKYGPLALVALAISGPIGVPIPLDVMVIGLSLSKPKKAIHYGLLGACCSVIGGTIAFLLGWAIGGDRVIAAFQHLNLGHIVDQALHLYREYDFWAVAISALTPVPYTMFSWLGGMAEISIWRFIWVSLIFRIMRFGGEGVLLYFYGQRARNFIEKYFNLATVLVMAMLVILYLASQWLQSLIAV
ncbi:MAG TPA: VTT domain-containing protein [Sedimentisphaerales bacterium]|nr:VTT domain-containing protein [Sedimentisphaerales bacterium]